MELSNSFSRESTFILFVPQSDLGFETGVIVPVLLLHAVSRLQPLRPLPCELLDPRFQHRLMLLKIIKLADPQSRDPRKAGGHSIHQTVADATTAGRHGVTRCDGVCHSEFGDFFFAADVCEGVAFEDGIRGEHGAGDFSVIGKLADELGENIIMGGDVAGI